VGAGLAGLSTAVVLAGAGARVRLIEAAGQAGGRCRSYDDPMLGMTLDNGNHLVLSGNAAVHRYLATIGALDRLAGPDEARLDFIDLSVSTRWALRLSEGPIPWWIAVPGRRVPGTHLGDYLPLAALLAPGRKARVDDVLACRGVLWRRLVEPFLLAALNSEPAGGSAALAGAVVRQSLARGGLACRPRIADPNLAAAFVDPALAFLAARGSEVHFARAVRALAFEGERVTTLHTGAGATPLGPDDQVVLAAPPWIAADLVPGLVVPDAFNPIVNAHFKAVAGLGAAPIVGVIGGVAEWIFAFADRISVTISNAHAHMDADRETLAADIWRDVAATHHLAAEVPPVRIVKERRATFAATPEQTRRRPPAATRWRNLVLAGDWTDTGLPATIEGALLSGETAARLTLEAAARPVLASAGHG
ncbi:MAG: FAD-dependent oxidoreductase, partial [Caulobacteraceae bacterium]|nr:FAD-dependent oxidoreductase [Caulobacteraceae bacterium]